MTLEERLAEVMDALKAARQFVRGRHSTLSYGPRNLVEQLDKAVNLYAQLPLLVAHHHHCACGDEFSSIEEYLAHRELVHDDESQDLLVATAKREEAELAHENVRHASIRPCPGCKWCQRIVALRAEEARLGGGNDVPVKG